MTTLQALTRAVRWWPWDRAAKRALIDHLQEHGIDAVTAAQLVASVARSAHLRRWCSNNRHVRRIRQALNPSPLVDGLRKHLSRPITPHQRMSRDNR